MKRMRNQRSQKTSSRKSRRRLDLSIDSAQEMFEKGQKRVVSRVSKLAEEIYQLTGLWEEMERYSSGEEGKASCRGIIDQLDDTLALMARNLTTFISIRSETTRSTELLCHVYSQALGNLERFPSVWRKLGTAESNDTDSSDSPGFSLLHALTEAVRFFESECEKHPQLFRHWAQEQPFLPMLVFRNKAAYQKRFNRLADAVCLGKRCPINVSPRANYSLETPINAKVFEVLMDFLWARDWIQFARKCEPETAWRKGATLESQLAEQADMPRQMQPIYFAACELPPLTKATASKWADRYVMPYLDSTNVDYLNAPEHRMIRRRKRVKSRSTARAEVRKDVIRALIGMARPVVPNDPHS
jgi:hypothetical protein